MMSLTITDLDKISKRDAAALRAIADVYHPATRNESMPVDTLKAGIQRGHEGALATLEELKQAATSVTKDDLKKMITPAAEAPYEAYAPSIRANPVLTIPQRGELGEAFLASVAGTEVTLNGTQAPCAYTGLPDLAAAFKDSVKGTAARVGAASVSATYTAPGTINPDDNPAAGAPDQHALADKVFSGGVPLDSNGTLVGAHTGVANLASENTFSGATPADQVAGWTSAPPAADPAQVFSGGGLATGGTVPANPGVLIGERPSEATTLPNVLAAIPTPPPLPAVMPQTLPQQSPAATNVSPPPPPPPAPAPAAASDAVATTSGVQTDTTGLPWDARIHASTKTMTAKNVWTRRRGVDDAVFNQVEAQLRAAMAVPAPAAESATTTAAWPFPTDSSSVTGAPTFPTLMSFITERVGDQRLTQAQVTAAVQTVGLESLNLVMARPDLIPAIMDELRKVAP